MYREAADEINSVVSAMDKLRIRLDKSPTTLEIDELEEQWGFNESEDVL